MYLEGRFWFFTHKFVHIAAVVFRFLCQLLEIIRRGIMNTCYKDTSRSQSHHARFYTSVPLETKIRPGDPMISRTLVNRATQNLTLRTAPLEAKAALVPV